LIIYSLFVQLKILNYKGTEKPPSGGFSVPPTYDILGNNMLSWARKRQIMYLGTILLIVLAILAGLYFYYKPLPTCFDGKKNQDELGVDCGGSCSKACSSQIVPLTTWWTRVFPTTPGNYDVAALVENQNSHFGVGKISYGIRLLDKNNVLLTERTGETFFNPQEKFVIYEANISTGSQVPATAFLYFFNSSPWQRVTFVPPTLTIGTKDYTNSPQPRLSAKVKNETLNLLRGTKFVAILSDENGNAFAASQTVLDTLAGNESKDLNFTWPTTFPTGPAVTDIYPKLNTFDGGTE